MLDAAQNVSIFKGFRFEGIPNRDSMKYVKLYGLDDGQLKNMFRGTLRYQGYTDILKAFRDIGLLDVKERGDELKSFPTWVPPICSIAIDSSSLIALVAPPLASIGSKRR